MRYTNLRISLLALVAALVMGCTSDEADDVVDARTAGGDVRIRVIRDMFIADMIITPDLALLDLGKEADSAAFDLGNADGNLSDIPDAMSPDLDGAIVPDIAFIADAEPLPDGPLLPGVDLTGRWVGRYDCIQGSTSLELSIIHNAGDALTAEFAFNSSPDDPDALNARFEMSGLYQPATAAVRLQPIRWLADPGGFDLVGLNGRYLPETNEISGRIDHPNCDVFSVTRMR